MNYPKVLIGIPYHPTKRYCLDATFNGLESLTYPNKEILLRSDPSIYGSENAVKKQREFFRQHALENGFDYLYFLGCDTIPPGGVIEKLLSHNKPIVGGVYWGRQDAENGRPEGAVAWIHDMSLDDQRELFLQEDKLLEVDGMGMDCVLFSREVLEKISWLDWEQNDDDYPYYDLAKKEGYKVYLDTGVQCKHYFSKDGYVHRSTLAKDL